VLLRIFGISFGVTIAGILGTLLIAGPEAALIVTLLAVLEISLSFDNAVINATVLRRMSVFWQRLFLTVGILIAVFGMRLLFPIVIVAITAGLGPLEVFDLALNDGDEYGRRLDEAHAAIAAFGGIFLYMIFLDFMFDEEREIRWLHPIEAPLARVGRLKSVSVLIALATLYVVGEWFAHDETQTVLAAGIAGIVTYLLVGGLGELFESSGTLAEVEDDAATGADSDDEGRAGLPAGRAAVGAPADRGPERPVRGDLGPAVLATGKAAFFLFLYLEVLDASFSFDGVIGAFAISNNIFIIAVGLGIGAMYIRSITVYLVRRGTLQQYVYLEHGAHYAIGALAFLLFASIDREIPEVVTGLIGVGFIGLALISSLRRNKRLGHGERIDLTHNERTPAPV
jgi:hypothetical protein